MAWLFKFPLLSLSLVLITYGVFGWDVANYMTGWTHWLVEQGKGWGWLVEEKTTLILLHVLAGCFILLITIGLTAPITLITIVFGSSFKSDYRAMVSVLLWSFAFVLIIRWISISAQILILISAAILGKLALQQKQFTTWQVMLLLTVICLGGFSLGIIIFDLLYPGNGLWLNLKA